MLIIWSAELVVQKVVQKGLSDGDAERTVEWDVTHE